ncbi:MULTISPECIES: serine/threonine-protein kinase [unclassified Frankia]|uniref:serine/threonine-protein kinase n=1 Tax=unclassified Frankia TaxID=2632575 RepID=UPI0027DC5220|nr:MULTISPECIES: serine/threonine-protein kinase [unclassified Frankia]
MGSATAPSFTAGEPLAPYEPTSVGPYVLLGRLGAGGMGTVYFAQGPGGRPVAVKVIRADLASDQEFRRRFRQEVDAARSVAPFCTAEVLDADPEAAAPYMVTEFIAGERLDEAVASRGALGSSTLTGLAIGVATALVAIHRAGLVHRDLKPGNVILSLSGPRVIDFGIAQVLDGAFARPTGWGFGSAGWMAPEQLTGQPIGPATDVFAWGMLVAYAGTGRHPFGGETDPDLAHRITGLDADLVGLPRELADLVRAALSKDPASRPAARELLLDLVERQPGAGRTAPVAQALGLAESPPSPPPTLPTPPSTKAVRRRFGGPRSWRPAVLAVGLLLAALLTIWSVTALRGEAPPPAATGASTPAVSTDASTSTASPTRSAAPSVSPTAGGFRDGSLRFVVDDVECGVEQLGPGFLALRPGGQFCLVTMTVRNTGSTARQLESTSQYAYDSAGGLHSADYLARFYLIDDTIWQQVGPGSSVHGRLVFDIPTGRTLKNLQLHDSASSGGVSIPL